MTLSEMNALIEKQESQAKPYLVVCLNNHSAYAVPSTVCREVGCGGTVEDGYLWNTFNKWLHQKRKKARFRARALALKKTQ